MNDHLPPCRGQNEREQQQQEFIELVDSQLAELFESQNDKFGEFN